MGRPKEALITDEAVVRAALGILERDGVEDFSVRRLAQELGVNAASFYHHFAGKTEILRSVARHVLREMRLPSLGDDWESWIVETSVQYRRLLVSRPFLIPIMLAGYRPRTKATGVTEAKLAEGGVPEALHPEIILALETCVIGSALVSIMSAKIAAALPSDDPEPDILKLDHERILRTTISTLVQKLVASNGAAA